MPSQRREDGERRSRCPHLRPCTSIAAPILPTAQLTANRRPSLRTLAELSEKKLPRSRPRAAATFSLTRSRSRCCAIRRYVRRSSPSRQNPDPLVEALRRRINEAVAKCPADMLIGMHMCRGNFKGHYLATAVTCRWPSDPSPSANVNHFLLEYDTDRAGDFAPLRFVPNERRRDRHHVHRDAGARNHRPPQTARQEAARSIDLDRLAIGPMRFCDYRGRQSAHRRG